MTRRAPQDVVEGIAAAVGAGSPLLLLSDFDGTLSPTVEYPGMARMLGAARGGLVRIAARQGCHVGIVSGRSLADLAGILGMPARFLAGSGGLELLCDGRRLVPPGWREAKAFIVSVVEDVRAKVAGIEGVWVEPKGCALTIHHRNASPSAERAVREIAVDVARRHPRRCRVIEGLLGIEITAFPKRDKSSAVRFFRGQAGGARVRLCYCGNDGNDAPAMAFVNACGGWSLGVGPAAPSEANCLLPDAEALSVFLATLADAIERQPPHQ